MSAAEIIEQIKDLPSDEKRKVIEFVAHLKGEADHRSFEDATDKVFAKHDNLLNRLAQ
jgi:phage terminase small subunit|tara:strand:+ start:178 stop:351 length:174 start_codon:yes stop_codon:yes gene_type:complete